MLSSSARKHSQRICDLRAIIGVTKERHLNFLKNVPSGCFVNGDDDACSDFGCVRVGHR